MRSELDKLLCEKYPKIFRDRHAPMQQTAMCWGICCGDGWFPILDDLCKNLQEVCDREGFQVIAVQVKEKFGGLRFYIGPGNDEIFDLIDKAQNKSHEVCETCGEPGKIRGHMWLYCACDKHTREEDKDDNSRPEDQEPL